MRRSILLASFVLAAAPAMAQSGDLNTTVRPNPRENGTVAAPISPLSQSPDTGAPSLIPEMVSPAGGDAPSGPANAAPYSAGPSSAGIAPTVGALPDNPGNAGTVPGEDPTVSK
jgi:hypothetical protein